MRNLRQHAFQRIDVDDDEAETAVIKVMVVTGSSLDKHLDAEVSVAEEQAPYALGGPELQQWMLDEYT